MPRVRICGICFHTATHVVASYRCPDRPTYDDVQKQTNSIAYCGIAREPTRNNIESCSQACGFTTKLKTTNLRQSDMEIAVMEVFNQVGWNVPLEENQGLVFVSDFGSFLFLSVPSFCFCLVAWALQGHAVLISCLSSRFKIYFP